jgi:RNA ligase (TIGR02306 family)
MKSTHKVECFVLNEFINHPNADLLKLIKIGDTEYYYCANYEQWKDKLGQVVAWVPPESLVDTTREEFKFLASDAKYYADSFKASEVKRSDPTNYALIKGKRIRNILSYGLVVSVLDTFKLGDDAVEYLGVIHYERELIEEVKKAKNYSTGGEVAKAPPIDCPHYDIDALLKYYRYLEGKEVVALEKVEGCNGAWTYQDGSFHCKSRSEWKREYPTKPNVTREKLVEEGVEESKIEEILARVEKWQPSINLWWKALYAEPELMLFLKNNPNVIVFGELYGQVKGFPYDANGKPRILVFDILKDWSFMDYDEAKTLGKDLRWVPELYRGPFDLKKIKSINENMKSFAGNHVAEGLVVRTVTEYWDYKVGRHQFKMKTPAYMEKK